MTATRVLVGHASAAGSTAGIAERVAATLRTAGLEVDLRPLGPDVPVEDVDAFVLGSAVHNSHWLPEAVQFLDRAAATLRTRPVWCFSVGGLAAPDRDPLTRWMGSREIATLARDFPPGVTPRGHRLFAGVVDMTGVPLWGRVFWRLMGGRPGDQRDWPAVEAWARQVAAELSTVRTAP